MARRREHLSAYLRVSAYLRDNKIAKKKQEIIIRHHLKTVTSI